MVLTTEARMEERARKTHAPSSAFEFVSQEPGFFGVVEFSAIRCTEARQVFSKDSQNGLEVWAIDIDAAKLDRRGAIFSTGPELRSSTGDVASLGVLKRLFEWVFVFITAGKRLDIFMDSDEDKCVV
mgnify:CR=1 FL=1